MISAKKTPEKSRYPVHYLVWHNKHRQLEKELAANEQISVAVVGPESRAEVMEVDHDRQLVFSETLCLSSLAAPSPAPSPTPAEPQTGNGCVGANGNRGTGCSTASGLGLLGALQPSEEQVAARLSAPVVTTQLDTRNIAFERNKTGILGWRSEKTELVNGYETKQPFTNEHYARTQSEK
ncbi:hypothetical protein CRUP_029898 [Coryphaenoides rupestris]|nr:hypothetical protein CRUP_029898 [Coryphaenoides rupestris]